MMGGRYSSGVYAPMPAYVWALVAVLIIIVVGSPYLVKDDHAGGIPP